MNHWIYSICNESTGSAEGEYPVVANMQRYAKIYVAWLLLVGGYPMLFSNSLHHNTDSLILNNIQGSISKDYTSCAYFQAEHLSLPLNRD